MADPDAILFDDDLLCWTDVEHEDIENSGDDGMSQVEYWTA